MRAVVGAPGCRRGIWAHMPGVSGIAAHTAEIYPSGDYPDNYILRYSNVYTQIVFNTPSLSSTHMVPIDDNASLHKTLMWPLELGGRSWKDCHAMLTHPYRIP